MALNQLKKDSHPIPKKATISPLAKKLKPSSTPGHPRVVTITTEQFLALASRLQQQGKGNGKPMIISLPKNLALSPQIKVANGKTACPLAVNKPPIPQLDVGLSDFVLNQQITETTSTVLNPVKPTQAPLSMPILTEEEPCSEPIPIEVNSTNDHQFHDTISTAEYDVVSTQEISSPSLEISPSVAMVETNKPVVTIPGPAENNGTTDERKNHFLKSGQLKGSARTTPIAVLCQRKKRKLSVTMEEYTTEAANVAIHSTSKPVHQPTLNNAAPPLDAEDDMFVNEESESSHGNNPPVWLSIMEEENSQFSAGAADNDDDLLDPSRLAAQLASIRQAASQYSFSS